MSEKNREIFDEVKKLFESVEEFSRGKQVNFAIELRKDFVEILNNPTLEYRIENEPESVTDEEWQVLYILNILSEHKSSPV